MSNLLPDGTCVTDAAEIDEDIDDAPAFNTSLGFMEDGKEIWYCTPEVTVVGIPCGPLLSPEEVEADAIINDDTQASVYDTRFIFELGINM